MTLDEIKQALDSVSDEKWGLVVATNSITLLVDSAGDTLSEFEDDDAAILASIAPEALRALLTVAIAAQRLVDIELHEHNDLAVDELYNELVAALQALK